MVEGKTLVKIEKNVAIFYDEKYEYYTCDGMYVEMKTEEEALELARSRGRNFLVNEENMLKLIDLGYVRDSFSYNEEGMHRETWREFLGKGNLTFFPDQTFNLNLEGNLDLLIKITEVIKDIYKVN